MRTDTKETAAILKAGQTGFSPTQMFFDPADENVLLAIYQNPRAALWNLETGGKQDLDHNESLVTQGAFDPKGRFIVTAAQDGALRLWTLGEGAKVVSAVPLRGHHGPVLAVDVNSDGTIVSGSGDKSVRFWRAASPSHPGDSAATTPPRWKR